MDLENDDSDDYEDSDDSENDDSDVSQNQESEYDDISDDDIIVVMEDGSYITIPYKTFSLLLQDNDFTKKLDEGFSEIEQLKSATKKMLG